MNNVSSKELTVKWSVYGGGRNGLASAMYVNAGLQTVKLLHFSVLSKLLLPTKQPKQKKANKQN